MSNQARQSYTPRPRAVSEETRAALLDAAERSSSLRVLLDHVAYLEEQLEGTNHWIYEECIVARQRFACEALNGIVADYHDILQKRRREEMMQPEPSLIWVDGQWKVMRVKTSRKYA
jgi:hypothetical protein